MSGKKYSWVKVGEKCKWNDPAITDYPINKRKEVLNRVFTIVDIGDLDVNDEDFDEDTIIEIDDGISNIQSYLWELKRINNKKK